MIKFDILSKASDLNSKTFKPEVPGALPEHILFINSYLPSPFIGDFCTLLDLDENFISIFDDYQTFKDNKIRSKIYLKNTFTPYISLMHERKKEKDEKKAKKVQDLEGKTHAHLADYVKLT
jgi:hypothetical protein